MQVVAVAVIWLVPSQLSFSSMGADAVPPRHQIPSLSSRPTTWHMLRSGVGRGRVPAKGCLCQQPRGGFDLKMEDGADTRMQASGQAE